MPSIDFFKIGFLSGYTGTINTYPLGYGVGYLGKEAAERCAEKCECPEHQDNPPSEDTEGEPQPGIPKGVTDPKLEFKNVHQHGTRPLPNAIPHQKAPKPQQEAATA